MKKILFSVLMAAPCLFAASLPTTSVRGEYIEARTADVYTGPCFANAEVNLVGNLAVFGWRINQGMFEGVNVDGLAVAAAVKANDTLGYVQGNPYPVKAVLIIDEKASPEQRLALKAFAKRMGGDLLQDIVSVEYAPIQFEINGSIHSGSAKMTAGTLASIQTRAMESGDHICRNEEVWYQPLTKTTHAMPAYTLANTFTGKGLNTTWSNPDKRSAFLGEFQLQ